MTLLKTMIALLLTAKAVLSQPLTVLSGEHDEFTRIVVYTRGEALDIGQTADIVKLVLKDPNASFDTTRAMRRLGPKRVQEIESRKNRLEISMNCDCAYETFFTTDQLLVLDIFDLSPVGKGYQQKALLEHLKDATTGGYQRYKKPKETVASVKIPIGDGAVPSAGGHGKNYSTEALYAGNEMALEVLELDRHIRTLDPVELKSEEIVLGHCPNDDDVTVASWSDVGSSVVELGGMRKDLFDELGRVDDAAANKLVRRYLYFGMTTEAIFLLSTIGASTPSRRTLNAIAHIMEGEHKGKFSFNWTNCGFPSEMWKMLANVDISSIPNNVADRIALEYSALPPGLRILLRDAFISSFREMQRQDLIPYITESEARRAKSPKDPEEAMPAEGIVESNSTKSIDGMAQFLESIRKKSDLGVPIDDRDIKLLESFQFQFSTMQIGGEIERALVEVYVVAGRFSEAKDLLKGHQGSKLQKQKMWNKLLLSVLTKSSDADFLLLTYETINVERISPRTDVMEGIIKRWASLGFSEKQIMDILGVPVGSVGLSLDASDVAFLRPTGADDVVPTESEELFETLSQEKGLHELRSMSAQASTDYEIFKRVIQESPEF